MNDFVEVRRVVSVVLHRWWLILLLTILAVLVGFLVSQQITPVYKATTSVIVGQSIQATNLDSRDIQTSERLALSYADIAKRQPILKAVNLSLDLGTNWQNLQNRVNVILVPDTQLLEISVEAGSAEEAILTADEIARQLVLLSPASLQNDEDASITPFVKQRLQDLQTKIETNQKIVNELIQEQSETSDTEEQTIIQAEIDKLENLLVEWENTYAMFLTFVGSETSTNYIAVVEKAHSESRPIRPSLSLNLLIAGSVGFALALGIIFLLEFLDDTFKTADDVAKELNLTILGTVGKYRGHDGLSRSRDIKERMIVSENPFSPVSESYRMIRSNLQFVAVDNPRKSILITSPGPGEGKSTTAVNLGIVMAHNGQKTILVDADLRRPVLHNVFQESNGLGLTNQFRNPRPNLKDCLSRTKVKNLLLLTSGETPPNPSELLGSQYMEQLLNGLTDEAELVIFDTPPAALVADAAVLAKQVDGVILVVSAGETRRDSAKQAVFNLQQSGANILGVVLNRASDKNGRYRYITPEKQHNLRYNQAITHLRSLGKKIIPDQWRKSQPQNLQKPQP